MRYYELLEYVLTSEFTMGFELECIAKDKDDLSNLYNSIFENNGTYKMNIGYDGTIDLDIEDYESCELRSEVFNITPKNITNIIKFLSNLNENNIFTNKSCGFHIHLKFPTYDNKESYWILLNLSVDDNMLNKLTKFKEYNFINETYANLNYLNELKDAVLNLNNSYIKQGDKYTFLTIHKQGTLEWRGPRDFLNKPKLNEIKDFVVLLYEFVSWISKTVSKKELNGKSKEFWLENIKKPISKNLINFLNEIVFKKK